MCIAQASRNRIGGRRKAAANKEVKRAAECLFSLSKPSQSLCPAPSPPLTPSLHLPSPFIPPPKPLIFPHHTGGAWLELVHVALGLAGGSVSSAFWQNFGRSFVLFAIVDAFNTPKGLAWLPALLLAWSGGELIR